MKEPRRRLAGTVLELLRLMLQLTVALGSCGHDTKTGSCHFPKYNFLLGRLYGALLTTTRLVRTREVRNAVSLMCVFKKRMKNPNEWMEEGVGVCGGGGCNGNVSNLNTGESPAEGEAKENSQKVIVRRKETSQKNTIGHLGHQ